MTFAIIFPAFSFFAARRLLTYLHIFQQDEYDDGRFLRWLWEERAFDRRASFVLLLLCALDFVVNDGWYSHYTPWLVALALTIVAFLERDPRTNAKKKLAITARAWRIVLLAAGLLLCGVVVLSADSTPVIAWIILIQLIPFSLPLANVLWRPYEARVQERYWQEARDKLNQFRPTIIGITGSYGKTSVKHILGHILGAYVGTLITPGSVNTPMGVARVIREQLTRHHRFFICEMGAYGRGSIDRLCRLAPPDVGIVTAIGHAHYERFKSIEEVAHTKSELTDAVIAKQGQVIIPEEFLQFPHPQQLRDSHKTQFVVVGFDRESAVEIRSVREVTDGIELDLSWSGCVYTLKAPLLGRHQAVNISLAFAAACSIGILPEDIVATVPSLPQIPHRLEVKRHPNDILIIDDAYNSNPIGFANALHALNHLGEDRGRRILVTPGMVELGEIDQVEHRKIGTLAGSLVDILVAIAPRRIAGLIEAYRAVNPEGVVVSCSTFAEAQSWMSGNLRQGDVVLIENDLPDLYERPLSL